MQANSSCLYKWQMYLFIKVMGVGSTVQVGLEKSKVFY